MADDTQGSRTFLAIVLGGIVLALVIAAFFMYGHKGDREVKVEQPMTETPATPAAEALAPETPASETPAPDAAPRLRQNLLPSRFRLLRYRPPRRRRSSRRSGSEPLYGRSRP